MVGRSICVSKIIFGATLFWCFDSNYHDDEDQKKGPKWPNVEVPTQPLFFGLHQSLSIAVPVSAWSNTTT
jgi:hypothetical protein